MTTHDLHHRIFQLECEYQFKQCCDSDHSSTIIHDDVNGVPRDRMIIMSRNSDFLWNYDEQLVPSAFGDFIAEWWGRRVETSSYSLILWSINELINIPSCRKSGYNRYVCKRTPTWSYRPITWLINGLIKRLSCEKRTLSQLECNTIVGEFLN